MSTKRYYMQLVTGEWKKDPALSACSAATRGIWIDLICSMHDAEQCGRLSANKEILARYGRCSVQELDAALVELRVTKTADVTFRNGIVTVTNRRMRREFEIREAARLRKWRQRSKKADHADVTSTSEIESESESDSGIKNPDSKGPSSPERKPRARGSGRFVDLSPEVLADSVVLRRWFEQETQRPDRMLEASEANWANVRAMAAKCLAEADDPVAMFKTNVREGRWDYLKGRHEDGAKAAHRESLRRTSALVDELELSNIGRMPE